MLIRSQDKQVLTGVFKADGIVLANEHQGYIWYASSKGAEIIGKYATNERCIEIIDDIQAAYNFLEGAYNVAPKNLNGAVYQMPEE